MTTTPRTTGLASDRRGRAPWLVRAPNGLVRRLLRLGLPMGPNVPLTVRGRTSGMLRTVPVAMAHIDGRRYVIGAYGDVHWVRNLRAAGMATIVVGGREEQVAARELHPDATRAFFAEAIPGYLARFPRLGRGLLRLLFRLVAPELLTDPDRAAATKPVFELAGMSRPASEPPSR